MLSIMSRWGRWGIARYFFLLAALCFAQKDPGVRAGLPGAGTPLNGLTPIELSMFQEGMQRWGSGSADSSFTMDERMTCFNAIEAHFSPRK